MRVHNIKLEARVNFETLGWQGHTLSRTQEVSLRRHRVNHGITWDEWWAERKTTITEHRRAGLIEVFCGCGADPMTFKEFENWCNYILGMTRPIDSYQWMVREIAYNYDTQFFRIEGAKRVSLQTFRNSWFNIYQKGEAVRIEHHATLTIPLPQLLRAQAQAVDEIYKEVIPALKTVEK